ncbi:MAG: Gx transporter family protein [Pseudomonadota bacterium]|nr:Gx transporter family protein [Pseudomonadota bacterium]
MPSLIPTHEDRLVAGYAALAIVIHVLEAGFPTLIPGIKPGLANVVTLIVLLRYSWRMALWVSLLRVLVGSLLVGSFMAPGFWLSLSGAVTSLSALGMAYAFSRAVPALRLSPIGLSVISALAHMAGQFALAYQVFVPHPGLLRLLPLLMSVALLFGLATGLAAQALLQRLPSREPPRAA